MISYDIGCETKINHLRKHVRKLGIRLQFQASFSTSSRRACGITHVPRNKYVVDGLKQSSSVDLNLKDRSSFLFYVTPHSSFLYSLQTFEAIEEKHKDETFHCFTLNQWRPGVCPIFEWKEPCHETQQHGIRCWHSLRRRMRP